MDSHHNQSLSGFFPVFPFFSAFASAIVSLHLEGSVVKAFVGGGFLLILHFTSLIP